jgi:hypothetical protein
VKKAATTGPEDPLIAELLRLGRRTGPRPRRGVVATKLQRIAVYKEASGQCQCAHDGCGHAGRCADVFTFEDYAASDDQPGWHLHCEAPGSVSACLLLCSRCLLRKRKVASGG